MNQIGALTPQADSSTTSTFREAIALSVILALALGVRLTAVIYGADLSQARLTEYETIARNLIVHGYFGIDWLNSSDPDPGPSSFMPPLYPIVLAGITAFWPQEALTIMRLFQATVSTFCCLGIYLIARDLFEGGKVTALLAAVAASLYPPFLGPVIEINTATFEVAFLMLAVYFLLRSRKRFPMRNLVVAGLLFGLAALTKATALVALPATFLWLWVNRGKSFLRTVAQPIVMLLAATLITILPWTIRNYGVHRAFVLISTNRGINFWIGNNENASGEYVFPRTMNLQLIEQAVPMKEVDRDRMFFQRGLDYIRANPEQAIRLFTKKLLYSVTFRPSIGSNYTKPSPVVDIGRLVYPISYMLVLPFWVTGLWISRRQWRKHLLLYGIIAGYLAVSATFFVGTRFRTPIDPYLLIFSALTVVSVCTQLTDRSS